MMSDVNRVWRLRKRPVGEITDDVLSFAEEPIPAPQDGKFLVSCGSDRRGARERSVPVLPGTVPGTGLRPLPPLPVSYHHRKREAMTAGNAPLLSTLLQEVGRMCTTRNHGMP
jgi:hypothetical protein